MKDHKLAEFNFKWYHKILPSEQNLFRWKIQNTDICNICGEISDEIHIIFACKHISHVWKLLYKNGYIKQNYSIRNSIFETFFVNNNNTDRVIALTNLCYAIYTEWLNQKSNNYLKRSETEVALFLIKKV